MREIKPIKSLKPLKPTAIDSPTTTVSQLVWWFIGTFALACAIFVTIIASMLVVESAGKVHEHISKAVLSQPASKNTAPADAQVPAKVDKSKLLSVPLKASQPSNSYTTVYGRVEINQKDIDCLILNAYHEARGEGTAGVQAVTLVVLNRTAKKHMKAKTICDTIYKPKQFSWTHLAVKDKPLDPAQMLMAKNAVMDLLHTPLEQLSGTVQKVKDSLYYHETNINWKYKTAFNKTGSIQNHIFYV
jgi:spore germination cell wall hydrolase CwlJ-like protein